MRASNNNNFNKREDNILCKMGNVFEEKVFDIIRQKFPNNYCLILESLEDVSKEKTVDTYNEMKKGTPFILQAPLYNDSNKTFGVADILIRSDYINKLIEKKILTDNEENIKAPNLDAYHYRVIDVKWSTIYLCANQTTIRNSNRYPAYKGQLAIYNATLGQLQGYTPNKAYVLGKGWKYRKQDLEYFCNNAFDSLGEIHFDSFDHQYLLRTTNAIEWVRDVRVNGNSWSVDPPSRPELYPNMNNKYDDGHKTFKRELSNNLHELTDVWMVSKRNREIAHKKGIYGWDDPNCTSYNMGINGERIGPIIDLILEVARGKDKIYPKKIKNNSFNWKKMHPLEFFIDFETFDRILYEKNMNPMDNVESRAILFMYGVGHVINSKWTMKSSYMETYDPSCEYNFVQEFVDYVTKIKEEHCEKMNIDPDFLRIRVFHWGNAEKTILKQINTRYGKKWDDFLDNIDFIDLCRVFKEEPIIIKGALKFNLKEIAKNMYRHGMIETSWEDEIVDGSDAMMKAVDYYQRGDSTIINNILRYNEVDCKVLYEILLYLRKNHC